MSRRITLLSLSVLLTCLFCVTVSEVQAAEYERLILRNVRIIDPDEETGDNIIEILVEDKNLILVTEDTIAREDTDLVVDANKGVLIGSLKLGASFQLYDLCRRSA